MKMGGVQGSINLGQKGCRECALGNQLKYLGPKYVGKLIPNCIYQINLILSEVFDDSLGSTLLSHF